MATLSFDAVAKAYGTTRVLERVDLEVQEGEYLVLVGPSGCGKSTLLRCIAGLEEITSGELRIDDRRVNEVAPRDRDVAMVFQSYALYPHLTVRDNLAFPLRLRKEPEPRVAEAIAEVSRMLGLDPLLDRRPAQLSGGQRQRVAMGRAIVRRPKVFLFDEPLSNLDATLRHQVRAELKKLHQQLRATIVHVTHDQVEAMTLADRILVLDKGVVQQIGSPRELYDTPVNTFVARFLGAPAMNLVSVGDGSPWRGLPADPPEGGGSGPMILGFRPQDAELVDGDLAEVDWVESLGSEAHVHLHSTHRSPGMASEASEVVVVTRDPSPFRAGQRVGIRPSRVSWFDAATGRRL